MKAKDLLKKAGKTILVVGGIAALVAGGLFAAQALSGEDGEAANTEDAGTEAGDVGEVTGG